MTVLSSSPARTPARRRWLAAAAGVAVSVAAHLVIILALIWQTPSPTLPVGDGAITVDLLEGPPEFEPPSPETPPDPSPPKPDQPKAEEKTAAASEKAAKRAPKPTRKSVDRPDGIPALAAVAGPSEAELAHAATAASAPRGGACNMTELVQKALRSSRRAQAAMDGARQSLSGHALMVWNGSWVRSSGEDGDGLAGLREIMITEIAFAPKPCQAQAMHGLVLISMADGPGAPRVVLGAGEWRWSDLLMAGRAGSFSP